MKILATLLALTSFGLATTSEAQEQPLPVRPANIRGRAGSPPVERVLHVTYDVASDRIRSVRDANPNEFGLGSFCFDNSESTDPSIFPYVVANSGEDLLNWGTKNCPGASRLRSFTMAYRSEANDPAFGGPGAVFSVALYSGTTGFGQPGTEVFRHTFSGLPTAGGLTGFVIFTVDFGIDPLPLADGAFGWSYLQLDGDSGPLLVRAPKPLLGTRDAIDIYSPGPATPATYIGTFNYGGCTGGSGEECANTWMQLDEIANNEVADSAVLNGSGANPVLLREIFPARLGRVWAVRVDATVPDPYANPYTILFGSRAAAATPISTRYGEFLLDPAQQAFRPNLAEAGYTFSIPADTALVGLRFFVQAAVLPPANPSVILTNALRVRIGY
jgi:hypothetical protein